MYVHDALVDSSGLEVLMNEPGVVSKMFTGTLLHMGTPSFFLIILPSLVFPYFESRVESSHDTVAVLHSNRNRIFNHVNKSASYIVISTRILV